LTNGIGIEAGKNGTTPFGKKTLSLLQRGRPDETITEWGENRTPEMPPKVYHEKKLHQRNQWKRGRGDAEKV